MYVLSSEVAWLSSFHVIEFFFHAARFIKVGRVCFMSLGVFFHAAKFVNDCFCSVV